MNCPTCGAESKVTDSRPGAYDTIRRRRVCSLGHRFFTVEMHSATASQAPHSKQHARYTTKRAAFWRDIEIARAGTLGRSGGDMAKKYGLKTASVYAAARRGRASLAAINKFTRP